MKKVLMLILAMICAVSVCACNYGAEVKNNTADNGFGNSKNTAETENDTSDKAFDNAQKTAARELMLLADGDVKFKLNAEISTIGKEPVSEKEGRGDGFHWKEYSYEDIFVKALIGDDNSTQIIQISTTSNKYKTPRDVKVGDTLQKLMEKYPEDLTQGSGLYDEIICEYIPNGIGVNRIYFYTENDIITKIVIENGIDG